MRKIPGIYVEIKGDFGQLRKDISSAKQVVTEHARGMSDALNNALSPGQIKAGVNGLVVSLGSLSRSAHLTSKDFDSMGVNLGKLQGVTGVTSAEFAKLQKRMLETKAASVQEKSLKNIAKAANLTESEIRKLGAQMNVSQAAIDRTAASMQRVGKSTEFSMRKFKDMIITVGIYAVAFQSLSAVTRGIGQEFVRGLKSVEDFNLSVAASASFITTFSDRAKSGDVAGAYEAAAGYAERLAEKLEIIDAKTIASGKDLMTMSETFIQQGVLLDINNKKQVDGFTNIANALALVTAGQNKDIQMRQEINALMLGQFRSTDRIAKLLLNIDPNLKENLKTWKEQGTVIEHVGELLAGFSSSTGTLDSQWVAVGSTMATIHNRILRDAFRPMFEDLIGLAKGLNSALMDAEGNLTWIAIGIQETINGAYQLVKALPAAMGEAGKSMISGVPVFGNMISALRIANGLKDELFEDEGKGSFDIFAGWKEKANELKRLRSIEDPWMKSARQAPTISGGGGDVEVEKENKLSAEKELRLRTRLRKELADLDKSYNAIVLANNKNARELDLQNLENNYSDKIISLASYIKKKQEIEVADAKEKVRVNQENVESYKNVLNGEFEYGTKGLIDKANATINLNKATIDLKNSEAGLAVLLAKNGAEMARYRREEVDYIKKYKIEYASQANRFEVAERIRQTTIQYTTELIRLQQDALEGVSGAQEALSSFQDRGVKDIKIAKTKDQFAKDDIDNSAFGSSNEFDSITSKYTDMYRHIREIEDEFGTDSLNAKKARWGAEVDMARDSIDMITNVLMQGNESQFNAGKALAVSMAIINAALSVSKALTLAYPMNFVVAGLVGAAAGVQVSTIMSQQYEGRANGGPVNAGQTYIVNENRLTDGPEYFTPSVAGTITPASKMGGGTNNTVNQTINVVGMIDKRTSNQIANDAARKQRIASARFG